MHAERDWLRHHVFPRLEEELLQRRQHLEVIDLRQGVEARAGASEEQRELLILKVCFDEIARSRPFLIVLLGDRYGWIPPPERMEAATNEAGVQVHANRSVTALEIEFGLLRENRDRPRRCLFYLREPLPYGEMPEGLRGEYSEQFASDDEAPLRRAALEALKHRLRDDPEISPRLHTYRAEWDSGKGCVAGLEAWGNRVFEDLWHELEDDTSGFAASAASWEERERASLAEFVEHECRDFTGRNDTIHHLLSLARSAVDERAQWAACVVGASGSGKSALFSQLYRELETDPVIVLANAAGTGPRSTRVDAMLSRWIGELASVLEVENPLAEKPRIEDLDETFALLLAGAAAKQRVVILLDAINQFEPTTRARYLTWLPKHWPSNVRLLATVLPGPEKESLSQRSGVETIALPSLDETDAREVARKVCNRYHVPWNDAVWQLLAAKRLPDGSPAIGNPLWTTLAVEQLGLLDADDFSRAERQFVGDHQSRLLQLRCEIANRMPSEVPRLYDWLLAQTEKMHGEAETASFALAIALGRTGWREHDLRAMLPRFRARLFPQAPVTDIDALKLAELRRAFRAHIAVRGEMQQWDFSHVQLRAAIERLFLADPVLKRSLHSAAADYLQVLAAEDPIHCTEVMFHLIHANEQERAARYYGRSLVPQELSGASDALADHAVAARESEETQSADWIGGIIDARGLSADVQALVCERLISELDRRLEGRCTLVTRFSLVDRARMAMVHLTSIRPEDLSWQFSLFWATLNVARNLFDRGQKEDALAKYHIAAGIIDELVSRDPSNIKWQESRESVHTELGDLLWSRRDGSAALREFHLALQIAETRPSRPTGAADESMHNSATLRCAIGKVFRMQGKVAEAKAEYLAAAAAYDRIGTRLALGDKNAEGLAACHYQLGEVIADEGDWRGALLELGKATGYYDLKLRENPHDSRIKVVLAAVRQTAGDCLRAAGDAVRASEEYRAVCALCDSLLTVDPTHSGWLTVCADGHRRSGQLLASLKDIPNAISEHRTALALYERLAESTSGSARGYGRLVAASHDDLAKCYLAGGNIPNALSEYRDALTIRERLTIRDASSLELHRELSINYDAIGNVLNLAMHDAEGAERAFRSALTCAELLANARPQDTNYLKGVRFYQEKLADLLAQQGDLVRVLEERRSAAASVLKLLVNNRTDAHIQLAYAVARREIGDALLSLDRLEEAVAEYEKSTDVAGLLARMNQDFTEFQREALSSHTQKAQALLRQRDLAAATAEFRAALLIVERRVAQEPNVPEWTKAEVMLHYKLAMIAQLTEDHTAQTTELLACQNALRKMRARGIALDTTLEHLWRTLREGGDAAV